MLKPLEFAIFDVFTACRCNSVLEALSDNHIKYTFVPAICTGELQPLDLTFNSASKQELRDCFTRWYAAIVEDDLEQEKELSTIKPSVLKPIQARWLTEGHSTLSKEKDLIIQGFDKAGYKNLLSRPVVYKARNGLVCACSISSPGQFVQQPAIS